MAPFASKAQMRYLYANHPGIAKTYASKTKKGSKLPEKVKKKSGKKR